MNLEHLDIVLPYKKTKSDELRYCLRSLSNIPHRQLIIVGDNEPWFSSKVVHIPTKRMPHKYQDAESNILAALQHKDLSAEFMLFNDDFMVMKKVAELEMVHLGTLQECLDARIARTGVNSYTMAIDRTIKYLKRFGIAEPLNYSAHVPMIMNARNRLIVHHLVRQFIAKGEIMLVRSIYGNLFDCGGKEVSDVKAYDLDTVQTGTFASTLDTVFDDGKMGEKIKKKFNKPSIYENVLQ